MAPPSWTFYYHRESSRPLAEALSNLSNLKSFGKIQIVPLPNENANPGFGTLPYSVRQLLFFGHPDVILTYYDQLQPEKAVFAWEITDAKPATDHWMQLFPGLVGACESGVPSVFILQFKSKSDAWSADLESEFFYAYKRVMDIHDIPIYIANWKASTGGGLSEDSEYPGVPDRKSEAMKDSLAFLNKIAEYTVHGRDFKGLSRERLVLELMDKLTTKIAKIPKPSHYKRLCMLDSSGILSTEKALKHVKKVTGLNLGQVPDRILSRDKTIYFLPRPDVVSGRRKNVKESLIERIEKRNGNPYNGMPLAFDFMFCRLGQSPRERDRNLFIDLSEISFKEFARYHKTIHDSSPLGSTTPPAKKEIPRYSLHLTEGYIHELKDFIRQYCYAADLIILRDFVVPFY